VGGGFAGLMATRTLCRLGVDVTLFEARSQVGGRVFSNATFSNGRITEFGAELVGSIHTRWCALAIEYGLALISRMTPELYRGQQLAMKLTLDKPLSMDEIRAITKEAEDKVDALMGYWNELEIYRCADGCQKLASEIARDLQSGKHRCVIRLRRAVTRIDLSKCSAPAAKKCVWLDSKEVVGNRGALKGGPPRREPFDCVVFAIPPSVWAEVVFEPKHLHPKEPGQVGVMEMGNAVKFFSNLKERFWIREAAAPHGGSLALGQVWEGTDNQTRIGDQGIVLSVFAGARSPTPDEKYFKAELTKLYPNYPKKVDTHLADWPRQPFIRAGIVSPGKNQILTVGKGLNEPYQGRIFFAGDHTQMNHFGYMEGALRSGERSAALLVQTACGLAPPAPVKPPAPSPPLQVASAARRRAAGWRG
jgi:monoamine oxidase